MRNQYVWGRRRMVELQDHVLPALPGWRVALFPKIVGTGKGSAPPYDVVTAHGER